MTVGMFDCWPRKVLCGPGSALHVGGIITGMNKSRVLVFTDAGLKELPTVTKFVESLKAEGLDVSVFSEIGPNPTQGMVHTAVDLMRQAKPEVLIGIGGGSPIDVGKAANVVYTHGGDLRDYDVATGGVARICNKLLPYVAIPTTAGTGSEVSFVSVITDVPRRTKFGVVSPLLVPDVAVLDPELTVTMPPALTASTGLDALTHCIEAYTCSVGFAPADAMALHGIRMISESLRTAFTHGKDVGAREKMLVASMMGGAAFTLNGLGICHAMAHQLSAFFDIPHGVANAILLPRAMGFNLEANLGKFADIAVAMGADVRGLSQRDAAEKSIEMVEKLSRELGIPRYLDQVGASKDKIPELVERAVADPVHRTNPRPVTPADVEKMLRASFAG
ncbi:MAG: iron-containing alcohol dehydrogenase [Bacillota bacterium]|nr:iron-containing alcohol dehydrogenase [Bacillota bacterium]